MSEDKLKFPLLNAAGTAKILEQVIALANVPDTCGITIGSFTKKEKVGNEGLPFHDGITFTLNSIGLANPGYDYYSKNLETMIQLIHKANKFAIVSVVGDTPEEYGELAAFAFLAGADYVELNGGCPNVWTTEGQKRIITYDKFALTDMIIATNEMCVRERVALDRVKLGVKLSPISDSVYLKEVANVMNQFSSIKFIATMNTRPNCFEVGSDGKSVIPPTEVNPNGFGGMAGPAILPEALGQVMQFRKLLKPTTEIFGMGGVSCGYDMNLMLKAGATYVGVASALYKTDNPPILQRIIEEYCNIPGAMEKRVEVLV